MKKAVVPLMISFLVGCAGNPLKINYPRELEVTGICEDSETLNKL